MADEDVSVLRQKYGAYWDADYICGDDTFIAYLTQEQNVYVCMGDQGQLLDAPAGASGLLYMGDALLLVFYPDRETAAYSLWDDDHEFAVSQLDEDQWNSGQGDGLGALQVYEYKKSLMDLKNVQELWTGDDQMIARLSDGRIVSHMISVPVEQWTEMAEIQGTNYGAVGLKADGTVQLQEDSESGKSEQRQYSAADWTDVVDLEGGIFGLKRDGTIASAADRDGENAFSDWTDIAQISYDNYFAALKNDGTVMVTGSLNFPEEKRLDLSDWKDMQAIKVWYGGIAGITSDGTVMAKKFTNGQSVEIELPQDAPKAYVPEKPSVI
jgi:hypothetical protein